MRSYILVPVLALLCPAPGFAKTMNGKGALIVRDRSTQLPLAGATIKLQYPDTGGSIRKTRPLTGDRAITDGQGYAAARVYAGESRDQGATKDLEAGVFRATVEKPGYQSFEGLLGVFYTAFRKSKGTYLFLDEVHLSPIGRTEPSCAAFQSFQPEAEVQPKWGDRGMSYLAQVRVRVPAVLAHEYDYPLLRVGVLGISENPRKPQFPLRDDGIAPDAAKGDGVFTGKLLPAGATSPSVVDELPVILCAYQNLHTLIPREGRWHTWDDHESSFVGNRGVTVFATRMMLPVRWVTAATAQEARSLYDERFSANRPAEAVAAIPSYEPRGRLENPPPASGWHITLRLRGAGFGFPMSFPVGAGGD